MLYIHHLQGIHIIDIKEIKKQWAALKTYSSVSGGSHHVLQTHV